MRTNMISRAAIGLVMFTSVTSGQASSNPPEWTEQYPAFHIAGNLYYVGSKALASYLITTPQGNIQINSDLDENVPLI